jgi:branched-subunit amino acid aminotransferase/4-amino-4-deoxychorismate lyase
MELMSQGRVIQADPLWWADGPQRQRIQADPLGVLRDYGINIPAGTAPAIVFDVLRLVSVVWVEGRLVGRDRFHIDPLDEGLLFGRGVWESTRTINSVPWLWSRHIERLQRTCQLLDIAIAPQRLPTSEQVGEFVRFLSGTDIVIRLNVSAGRHGAPGMVWMTASLRPAPKEQFTLKTCPTPVVPDHPFLTWKTFQYANRLKVGASAGAAGFDSTLMTDAAGQVLEAAHANIFFKFKDGWATPKADNGLLLPGTVRQHLLEHSPKPIREDVIPLARLKEADEVFVTNSNVGLVPVVKIDAHTYPIGKDTLELRTWLEPDAPTAGQLRVTGAGM